MSFIKDVCGLTINGLITKEQEKIIWTKLNEFKGSSLYSDFVWDIVQAYKGIVYNIVKEISLGGYGFDDAISDGESLMYEAVGNYDSNSGASFTTYAKNPNTIKRRLIDIVNKYNGKPTVSLDTVISGENDKSVTLMDTIQDTSYDPEQETIKQAKLNAIMSLSEHERRVVILVSQYGEQYAGDLLYPDVENKATRRQKAHREFVKIKQKLNDMLESGVLA